MTRWLVITGVSLTLLLGAPVLAQVQLDHGTAEKLTALGIDTSLVVDQDDVGYINQILASDADDATKKAEIMKLLEEN
jgi:hypothetical protein